MLQYRAPHGLARHFSPSGTLGERGNFVGTLRVGERVGVQQSQSHPEAAASATIGDALPLYSTVIGQLGKVQEPSFLANAFVARRTHGRAFHIQPPVPVFCSRARGQRPRGDVEALEQG